MIVSRHGFALWLATALAGMWLGAIGLAATSARLPPEKSGHVIAVFPPNLDGQAVEARILAARGFPLERFGVPFAWRAYSRAEGFVGRLEEQGVVLAIPPVGELKFAGLCGSGMESLAPRPGSRSARSPVPVLP